jgi:hypothetical protein
MVVPRRILPLVVQEEMVVQWVVYCFNVPWVAWRQQQVGQEKEDQ